MIKDILDNLIKELHNEKNQENLYAALEPFSYKLKMSYIFVIVLLVLMLGNLVYTNILLSEIIKGSRPVSS